ncbi:MAG: hypothetical protein Q4F13_00640 [Pseudomonadota bacterium]|nr:hypothetical protein [Pseudomonadota bacterium]
MKPQLCLMALSLGAALSQPALAQAPGGAAMDMQHRHNQPGHPGYVGPRGSASQQGANNPRRNPPGGYYCDASGCYGGRELQVARYILKPSHGALVLVSMPYETKYKFATGATPAEAEQAALRECRDYDSRARCQIAVRLSNACVGVTDGYAFNPGGSGKAFTRVYITPVDLRQQAQHIELYQKRRLLLEQDAQDALRQQAMDMCHADASRTPGLHCSTSVGGEAFCALDEYGEEYVD